MGVDELWPVVVDYLASCSRYGRSHLAAFITRIPQENANSQRLEEIGDLCRHFPEELAVVHRIAAESKRRKGDFGGAVSHLLAAGDVDRVNSLVGVALQNFFTAAGKSIIIRQLSAIVDVAYAHETTTTTNAAAASALENSTALQFIRAYCRFHTLLQVIYDF